LQAGVLSFESAHCGQAAKFISAAREKRWQMCAGRVFERKKGAGWGQAHIWLFLLPLAKCAYNCARANGANKLANNCQMHHSARRKPNLICRRAHEPFIKRPTWKGIFLSDICEGQNGKMTIPLNVTRRNFH
jgi:hypothetical protein